MIQMMNLEQTPTLPPTLPLTTGNIPPLSTTYFALARFNFILNKIEEKLQMDFA